MSLDGPFAHGDGPLGVYNTEHGNMLVQVGPMDANALAKKLPARTLSGSCFSENGKEGEWRGVSGTVSEHHCLPSTFSHMHMRRLQPSSAPIESLTSP